MHSATWARVEEDFEAMAADSKSQNLGIHNPDRYNEAYKKRLMHLIDTLRPESASVHLSDFLIDFCSPAMYGERATEFDYEEVGKECDEEFSYAGDDDPDAENPEARTPEDILGDDDEEDEANLYHVLGVTIKATSMVIKRAWMLNILKYHPDKNTDATISKAKLAMITRLVVQAKEILLDPKRRRMYNEGISAAMIPKTTTATPEEPRPKPTYHSPSPGPERSFSPSGSASQPEAKRKT